MDDENPRSGSKMRIEADGAEPLRAAVAGISLEYRLEPALCSGVVFYTLTVLAVFPDGATECAVLGELTADRALAESILRALCLGAVTPCAARGVADDLLAAEIVKRASARVPEK